MIVQQAIHTINIELAAQLGFSDVELFNLKICTSNNNIMNRRDLVEFGKVITVSSIEMPIICNHAKSVYNS